MNAAAEQIGNPWLAGALAGIAMVAIVLVALGARRRGRGSSHPAQAAPAELRETVDQLEGLTDRLERLIDQADNRIAQLTALTRAGPRPPMEPVHDAAPTDPLVRRVYELSDEGRESTEIAQQLDEHVGKIELILALRDGSA